MSTAAAIQIASAMPHLTGMIGQHGLSRRSEELERLGLAALWQLERDLALVERYVPAAHVARAYGDQLRNAGQVMRVLYEARVAAMLAPIAQAIELAPRVGQGSCDLKCLLGGREVFFEVTTVEDIFPWTREELRQGQDAPVRGRTTVHGAFDPGRAANHEVGKTPRSHVLRQRIIEELRQLPPAEIDIVVVGTPVGGHSEHLEEALHGDQLPNIRGGQIVEDRMPNGLFTVPDEVGGTSGLSAVIWMKLAAHFADVRVHSRWFVNPRARRPPDAGLGARLQDLFDRRAVLQQECDRVKRILVDCYHPERVILFGSLADSNPDKIHQWSDLDLCVVKPTPRPFIERAGEVLDLIEPRVAVNVLVYTPDEFERAQREGHGFVVDEIASRGRVLFP